MIKSIHSLALWVCILAVLTGCIPNPEPDCTVHHTDDQGYEYATTMNCSAPILGVRG